MLLGDSEFLKDSFISTYTRQPELTLQILYHSILALAISESHGLSVRWSVSTMKSLHRSVTHAYPNSDTLCTR